MSGKKGRSGRKPYKFSAKELKQIEELSGFGLNDEQIGVIIGVSHDTLTRRKQDDPNFLRVYQKGRAEMLSKVGQSIYERALDGSDVLAIWLQKSLGGKMEEYQRQSLEIKRQQNKILESGVDWMKLQQVTNGSSSANH